MKTIFFLIFFSYSAYSQHIIQDASIPVSVNVSGYDGSSGRHGNDGSNASCDSEGNVTYRGADGEDGGDGADGKDGKNIVVHFQEIKELKNLILISQGGKGGTGGRPGKGGWGCSGTYLGSGSDGRFGRDGSKGSSGTLYLVKSPASYISPIKNITTSLGELVKAEVTLNDNVWSNHEYANDLLGQGSNLASTYYILETQVQKRVSINWQMGSDLERYKGQSVSLSLSGNQLSVSFPGAQVDSKITEQGSQTIITIYNIHLNSELFQIDSSINGKGLGLVLNLKNKSSLIDLSQLKGKISILGLGFFSSTTRYSIHHENDISKYVTIDGQNMIIRIGEMPFRRWHKRKGQKIEVILNLSYVYNGQVVSHELQLSHKI
jgi:hypothetical protein